MNQTARDILTAAREELSAKLAHAQERVRQLRLDLLHAGAAFERLTKELADLDAVLEQRFDDKGGFLAMMHPREMCILQPTPSRTTSPPPPKPIG